MVDALSDEDRLEMFRMYCLGCGSKDTKCSCLKALDEFEASGEAAIPYSEFRPVCPECWTSDGHRSNCSYEKP